MMIMSQNQCRKVVEVHKMLERKSFICNYGSLRAGIDLGSNLTGLVMLFLLCESVPWASKSLSAP
jgi:hypothetical protein